jgi:polysaccharide biosynthesis/export protein
MLHRLLAASLCLLSLSAVAAAAPPQADTVPVGAAAASVSEQPDYKLGPGDVIQVFVWRNPELTISVPVRPDGKISTPLVDDMVAIGKTPSQLARDMERVLSEYVLSPKVNIIVTGSTSAANQVKVMGQVRTPQSLAYRAGMTALDAVMAAGGLTDFAAGGRARILRKAADGTEQTIKVDAKGLLAGKLKSNVMLQPGDVLVVPESLF